MSSLKNKIEIALTFLINILVDCEPLKQNMMHSKSTF